MSEHLDESASAESRTPTSSQHRRAKSYHWARFVRQFSFWGLVIGAAAASYPIMNWTMNASAEVCHSARSCLVSGYYLANVVPTLFFIIFLVYHIVGEIKSDIVWRNAVKGVGNLMKHEVVIEGFVDFFDVYIRSKRRSYHLLTVGLLALAVGLAGICVIESSEFNIGIFWPIVLLDVLLGGVLVLLSNMIARAYLPGEIVVVNTLMLSVFERTIALQKDINIDKAREVVEKDIQKFVERKPWWFFN